MTRTTICAVAFLMFVVNFAFGMDVPAGFTTYTIQPGDHLGKIAPKELWPIVMKVNKIDANSMQVGHTILVPIDHTAASAFCPVPKDMPSSANEARKVFVFIKTQYFGAYEYGTLVHWGPISSGGRNRITPHGTFPVMSKHKDYFSHSPESYGAPMPYAQRLTGSGIFLHQQALPGKPASHGCIRLLMSDAQWLFGWTRTGDNVTITP